MSQYDSSIAFGQSHMRGDNRHPQALIEASLGGRAAICTIQRLWNGPRRHARARPNRTRLSLGCLHSAYIFLATEM
jgi:hypothetical protein